MSTHADTHTQILISSQNTANVTIIIISSSCHARISMYEMVCSYRINRHSHLPIIDVEQCDPETCCRCVMRWGVCAKGPPSPLTKYTLEMEYVRGNNYKDCFYYLSWSMSPTSPLQDGGAS